jgi:hypothetical protein
MAQHLAQHFVSLSNGIFTWSCLQGAQGILENAHLRQSFFTVFTERYFFRLLRDDLAMRFSFAEMDDSYSTDSSATGSGSFPRLFIFEDVA